MSIQGEAQDNNLEEEISSPLSEEQWQSLIEHVPEVGDLHKRSKAQGIPPTGVLFTILAEIGSYLPVGTRLEGYGGYKPSPISSLVVLLGKRSAGKTVTEEWTSTGNRFKQRCIIPNPPSGQGITKEFLNWQQKEDKDKKSEGDDMIDLIPERPILKPHGQLVFDEGLAFDSVANDRNHGPKFVSSVNSGWSGNVNGLNQAAAGADTRRIIPMTTKISLGGVVRTQPGFCQRIFDTRSGFGSRWLVCYVTSKEAKRPLGAMDYRAEPLLENWNPLKYSTNELPLDTEASRTATVLSQYSQDPFGDWDEEDLAEINKLDKRFIDMVNRGHKVGHLVWKFMRVAAALAVYECAPKVEMRHLYAAEVIISYSADVVEDYAEWCKANSKSDNRIKGENHGEVSAHASITRISLEGRMERLAERAAELASEKYPEGFTPSHLSERIPRDSRGHWNGAAGLVDYCLGRSIISKVAGQSKRYIKPMETQ